MTLPVAVPAPVIDRPLAVRSILRFYVPLVLNAWLMTLAGPVLNVAIARAAEPRLHLAAFWIAFTVLLFCQGACLIVHPVTVSLVARRTSLAAIAVPSLLAGLGAGALVLAIAKTDLGVFVFRHVIPTTPLTADLARQVLARMAPIPLLVSLRGLASGAAVADRRSDLVVTSTVVRMLVLAGVVAAIVWLGWGEGAVAAAGALVAGAAVEALFMVAISVPHWQDRLGGALASARDLAGGPAFRAALPVAVAGFSWTLTRPVVTAVLGRLSDPQQAQAGFGIVLPVLLASCSPLWALLEVAIVLPRSRTDLGPVLRFAAGAACVFTVGIAAVTWTDLREPLLRAGLRGPTGIEPLVLPALALVALEPVLLATRAISQGLLMRTGRAGVLLALSPVKIVLIAAAGALVAWRVPGVNGAVLGIALLLGGDLVDAVLYARAASRAWADAGAEVFAVGTGREDDALPFRFGVPVTDDDSLGRAA